MFARLNPYDDIIAKATDEKQTEIDWSIALTVWDKVNEDGEQGARNCVAALQKRLNHRSANVQLYSLTLAGALVNNCGPPLHREISGKVFTQTLVRLINDRTTHDTVKRKALSCIEDWVKEHPSNADFDLLLDTYESLKRQGHVFPSSAPAAASSSSAAGGGGGGAGRSRTPPRPTDEQLRREEEDLQRALAESAALADPLRGFRRSSPPPSSSSSSSIAPAPGKDLPSAPRRVRALFDFTGQTADELPLSKGDTARVVEEISQDWWRGESERTGRRGIFPTNYVEVLPPSASPAPGGGRGGERAGGESEDEVEAAVFAQAAAVDRLLGLMQTLRARGEDFAENEELTDLYNSSMRLRPKVFQLIRKYEQKQADLQGLSDKVAHAKATYEQLTGIPSSQPYGQPQQHTQPNGYHPSPSHPHQHQQPARAAHDLYAHPSSAASPAPAPQLDHPQQQQYEDEQRREYERQYAEYLRQLEEYNRRMAELGGQQQQAPPPAQDAQPQQQQLQQGYYPPPVGGAADPSAHPPAPGPSEGASTPAPAQQHPQQAPPPSAAQPQPQPVYDPTSGQWVWPTQHAHAYVAPLSTPGEAPAPALSPVAVPSAAQGYPGQTQPYEQSAAPAQQLGGVAQGLAARSVGSAASPPPPPAPGSVGSPVLQQQQQQQPAPAPYYQQQQPPQQQQPQTEEEIAAAWAAYHADQAQAAQAQQQGGYAPAGQQ